MAREFSECQTFTDSEQDMDEPETEDFFAETIQNSLKTKKKGYKKPGKDLI